jgi:CRISPR-associated protein Cmr6
MMGQANILDSYEYVPMMFRAQADGRCQVQRIPDQKKRDHDIVTWTTEWTHGTFSDPLASKQAQERIYTFNWRLLSNSGVDDALALPVIGAHGMPYYPGSSMKGAFRETCRRENIPKETCDLYCGTKLENGDTKPGILRFHGGYPVNNWMDNLVDIVHPQQSWQMKEMDPTKKPKNESAFTLLSLYKPIIKFAVSSQLKDIDSTIDWEEVWGIWKKAIGYGIGSKVSSGYGIAQGTTNDKLYQVSLQGQGSASKLLTGESEFRPNIFRAAIRGHALRIFSGLNSSEADDIVDELFGGIRPGKEKVGLLGIVFHQDNSEQDEYSDNNDAYSVNGNLIWSLFGKLNPVEDRDCLVNLIKKLFQFAMLLGGFGKSWRRADHSIFWPKYKNHLIGCHWCWINNEDSPIDNSNAALSAEKLIEGTVQAARSWMNQRGYEIKNDCTNQLSTISPPTQNSNKPILKHRGVEPIKQENQWREKWTKGNAQVWCRVAKDKENSTIIPLLHSSLQNQSHQHNNRTQRAVTSQSNSLALQRVNQHTCPSIYRSCLTGRVKDTRKSDAPTQIGRLWHRMYPLPDEKFLEIVTVFPNGCNEANEFLKWLPNAKGGWKQIW